MGLEKFTPDQLRDMHSTHLKAATKCRALADEQDALALEVLAEFCKRVEAAPRKKCKTCGAEKIDL